jgi:hypothetical protein
MSRQGVEYHVQLLVLKLPSTQQLRCVVCKDINLNTNNMNHSGMPLYHLILHTGWKHQAVKGSM